MTEAELRAQGFVPEEEVTPSAPDVHLPPAPEASTLDTIKDYLLRTNPATAGAKGVVDLVSDPQKQVDRLRSAVNVGTGSIAPWLLEKAGAYAPGEATATYNKATAENPIEGAAGGVASAAPAGAIGGLKGVLARLGIGSGLAATQEGLGNPSSTPESTAMAAGGGLALSGGAETVGAMLRGLGRVETGALSDLRARGEGIERDRIASALGKMRQQRADANRTVELIEAAANDPGSPHILEAQRVMNEPWFRDLKNGIQSNAIDRAPDAAGGLRNAETDFEAAKSAAPGNLEAYMREKTASPLVDAMAPGVRRYAGRAMGQAIGSEMGGPAGQFVGGAVMGSPGTWAGNLMRNPQFQLGASRAAQSALTPARALAPVAAPAARAGTTFKEWLDSQREKARENLP